MKILTLQVFDEDTGTITHQLDVSDDTWITQLEVFRKFLLAQGYHIDKRIAVVEPETEHDAVMDIFYEQIQESCWLGEIVSQTAIKSEE